MNIEINDIVRVKGQYVNKHYVVEKLITVRGQHRAFVSSICYPNFASMTRRNVRVEDLTLIEDK